MDWYCTRKEEKNLKHSDDELQHYGILGMKWGIRRFQNPDGSLTRAGRKRYLNPDGTLNEAGKKRFTVSKEDMDELDELERIETLKSPSSSNKKSFSTAGIEMMTSDGKHFTQEYYDTAIRKAIEDDIFNSWFLEIVQNNAFAMNENQTAKQHQKMLKEYNKFLMDPYNYKAPEDDKQ